MLTTSRTSRRRLAAGSAAVTLLMAGGLGLTASSNAAERITAGVDDALQVAVAAPPPEAAPAPLASPPPPTVPAPAPGVRHTRRVVVVRNGNSQTFEGAAADDYIRDHELPVPPLPPVPPAIVGAPEAPRALMHRFRAERGPDGKRVWSRDIPEVSNARCPGDTARPAVEHSEKGGKHRILICTNRIEAMARDAERLALNSAQIERGARSTALEALQRARETIVMERNLTEDQRRGALEGVDEALAEMRADTRDDD